MWVGVRGRHVPIRPIDKVTCGRGGRIKTSCSFSSGNDQLGRLSTFGFSPILSPLNFFLPFPSVSNPDPRGAELILALRADLDQDTVTIKT